MKEETMNFPDLPHLMQLQKDLWQWPRSRAAVMVGAGFSRNAEPLPGVTSRFLDWRQLVRVMFDEMHPAQPNETPDQRKKRDDRFNSKNALRIASEYEAAFDRRKLDLLIQNQTPNNVYQPGKLHRLLLQLPWVDVFTTNYDTLLEKTELDQRAYHVVTKPSELTTAFSPRIVKLHGSFPAQTPYIITEEDYRCYPKNYAPLVNTVQQSLLENTFVLLGFSGDDPNFLEWTGWIQDELGNNHAPIYLVGPLSVGSAERALLARRGVTPIDLSSLFPNLIGKNELYSSSIEWFLSCLVASQPSRAEDWPDSNQVKISLPVTYPNFVVPDLQIPEKVYFPSNRGKPLGLEDAKEVLTRWRYERQHYPGWIVAPDEKREELWLGTKYWVHPLTNVVKSLPCWEQLLVFREINWRFETAMVPLFPEQKTPFDKVVVELFELLKHGKLFESGVQSALFEGVSADEVIESWFGLAFALLRESRETYNEIAWEQYRTRIKEVISGYPKFNDRYCYEQALWFLWQFDRKGARQFLVHWNVSPNVPLPAIWKAGILAELDELGESKTLLRTVLGRIRYAQNTVRRNIELLSLEGWCSYLLFAVEQSIDLNALSRVRAEFQPLWRELKAWDCSPWPVKEFFDLALVGTHQELKNGVKKEHGFDPGSMNVNHQWSDDLLAQYLPAFACVRLYEQVGIPLRIRGLNMGGTALKNASRRIAAFVGFGSLVLLIRASKHNDIVKEELFSRAQVASMDESLVHRLFRWCVMILERELAGLRGLPVMDSVQETLLEVLPEIVSRLEFRVSPQELEMSFSIAVKFHCHTGIMAHIRLHETSQILFKRIFLAAENHQLIEWLPSLIELPLFSNDVHPIHSQERVWPDPLMAFPFERMAEDRNINDKMLLKIQPVTDWLIRRAASESGEGLRRAKNRLISLHDAKLLTANQSRALAMLIWQGVQSGSLPDDPALLAFSYLYLPAPEGVNVSQIVKKHILSMECLCAVSKDNEGKIGVTSRQSGESFINEALLVSKPVVQLWSEPLGTIEWTNEESKRLLKKVLDWWSVEKMVFDVAAPDDPFGPFSVGPVINALKRLPNFFARAVLPYMDSASESDWELLLNWLQDMRKHEVFPSIALPYVLIHRPIENDNIAVVLTADLESDSEEQVKAAAYAIRHWAKLADTKLSPEIPTQLVLKLINRVAFREKVGIVACVHSLTLLLLEVHDLFKNENVMVIAESLTPWNHALRLRSSEDDFFDFDESEKLDLRVVLGRLSGAVKNWLNTSAFAGPMPPGVMLWEKACASETLPEVRRAFNFWQLVTSQA